MGVVGSEVFGVDGSMAAACEPVGRQQYRQRARLLLHLLFQPCFSGLVSGMDCNPTGQLRKVALKRPPGETGQGKGQPAHAVRKPVARLRLLVLLECSMELKSVW